MKLWGSWGEELNVIFKEKNYKFYVIQHKVNEQRQIKFNLVYTLEKKW